MNYLDKLFESLQSAGLILDEEQEGIEFNSPNVFGDEDEDESTGPQSTHFEETFNKINVKIGKLDEANYKDFRNDESLTAKQKLNNCILEINKGLAASEKLIGHAIKLKTEVGADQTIFFKETFRKFTKIGERMNRLQSKIREFSK